MSKKDSSFWANQDVERKAADEETCLNIYTNPESKSSFDNYCDWHFQVYSEDYSVIKQQSGSIKLCDCEECHRFGENDVFEYFSICEALRWVNRSFCGAAADLWIGSNRFLNDFENQKFGQPGRYACAFLRTLDNDIARLLGELAIDVFLYGYVNKDAMRIFPEDFVYRGEIVA